MCSRKRRLNLPVEENVHTVKPDSINQLSLCYDFLAFLQQWKQAVLARGSELVFKCLPSCSCWSMRFWIKGKLAVVAVRYGTSECGSASVGSSCSVVTLYRPG